MTDVNPFFAALTDENKSYFKSSTTVISKFSSIVPFSMYCNGVPFPTEHDPVAGVISFKCLLIGEFVEITNLDAPESKYILTESDSILILGIVLDGHLLPVV